MEIAVAGALVRVASRLLLLGVTLVMAAVLGGVLLILDWVVSRPFALTTTAVLGVVLALLWFVLPLRHHRALLAAIRADRTAGPGSPPL